MDYYSQRRCSSDHYASGPGQPSPSFRTFNQRRYWGMPPAHRPQGENLPYDFTGEYDWPLPYQPWSPGQGCRRSESNPPSYLRPFPSNEQRPKNSLQYSFFTDSSTHSIWPYTTDGDLVYPDSVEEPQSDSAESLHGREGRHCAEKHDTKTQKMSPETLPPPHERCETIHSNSSHTSPSVSQHKTGQQASTFSSFGTFAFPSVSNSDASTPSRPNSSSPPISPHTNEPSPKENRSSYEMEHRRLQYERRLNKQSRRKLMKEFKELRLREKLVREREIEIGIRAKDNIEDRNEYMETIDGEGRYMSDAWWNIPGILD